MTLQARDTHAKAAAIVARISRADAANEIADRFQSQVAAFEHLSTDSRADIVHGLSTNRCHSWKVCDPVGERRLVLRG